MPASVSKRSNSKSARSCSALRRSARLARSSASAHPATTVDEDEHNLYLFLFCNYLVWKVGVLPPERVEDLNNLGFDWLSHVEEQEGIPTSLRDCPMSKETATACATERFRDNSKLMVLFTGMIMG